MDSEYYLKSTTKSSAQKSYNRSPGSAQYMYEGTSSAGSPSLLNRSGGSGGGSAVDDLRADSDDKAWLEKNNFDLKMKVYYLEETMKKMIESGAGNSTHSDYAEELRAENTSLRLQVEEKCLEMEQRNTLLVKAKTAIETLKAEISKLRADKLAHSDTESRVRSLIRENEELEAKHRFKMEQLEVQVATLQQAVNMKEHGSHASEEKLRSARSELEDSRRRCHSLEEDVRSLQKRLGDSHTELIETRSEVDSARIQLAEQVDAITDYKGMIAELQEMVTRLSDDRERVVETSESRIMTSSAQFESLIENIKKAAEQDMEHTQHMHSKLINELKESHSKELERVTTAKEEALRANKNHETTELFRMREDLQVRLQEKQEEVRALKSAMEMDRVRLDSAARECEDAKAESRQRLAIIDSLRAENASIEVLKVELRQSQEQCKELKTNLHQDVVLEKNQLLSRIEVLSDNLESSRDTIRDLEHSNSLLTTELTKIKDDMYDSRKKLDSHNEVARENERLKASSTSLREEVKELSGLLQTLQAETKSSRESLHRSSDELDRLRKVLSASEAHANALEEALREERSKHTAADAGLNEHRDLTSRLSHQLDEEKQRRSDLERRGRDGLDRLDSLRADIGKTCSMLSDAVEAWDRRLEEADVRSGDNISRPSITDLNGEERSKLIRDYVQGSLNATNNEVSLSLQQLQSELLTTTIVRIERFRAKVDRLVNIKQSFELKCDRMLKTFEDKVSISTDRMKVQSHRLDGVETHFTKIKNTLDRDAQKRSTDVEEMKAFRESVVSGHSQQIQAITTLLEKERSQNTSLRNELDDLSSDMREYRNQAKEMEHMEEMVSSFKSRFGEVVESNRLLMLELDDRAKKFDRLKREYSDLAVDKDDAVADVRSLSSKIQVKDDEMENLRRQISYYRSREIDPELEKSFRETQSIMRSYHSPEKDNGVRSSNAGSTVDAGNWIELVAKISSVYKSASSLVSSTTSAVDSFADLGNRSALSRSQLRDTTELIFELLDSNSKVSMQVKRLSSEVKSELEDRTQTEVVSSDSASKSRSPNGRERTDRFASKQDSYRRTDSRKKETSPLSSKAPSNTMSSSRHQNGPADMHSIRHSYRPEAQRQQSYDSEPEQFTQIHPEAPTTNSSRPTASATPCAAIVPIKHSVIPSRRGLQQRETYDSEPEEILKVHPEVQKQENNMFRNMESHFKGGASASKYEVEDLAALEQASRRRGWSESSCPPGATESTPLPAQVHPIESIETTTATQPITSAARPISNYSNHRESSPLTLSHFGASNMGPGLAKHTPQQPQYANSPQSRGSASRVSSDRLHRLGEDLTVLARKLDSFDSSSRVKY